MRRGLSFLFCLAVLAATNALATPPAGYYEVWGDEFNGTSLDPTKWWVWNQPDRSGYSTPDAVTVSNGVLTVHVYSTNGQNYSGIVSSDGRFRQRYGYLESSVEFNGSPGMFSDFWVNSANNGQFIGNVAASGAEVDVCEHRVTDANDVDNITGQVTVDLHWNGYGSSETSGSSGLIGMNLGTGFHTYGFLWNSTNYTVSFDNVPMWSTNNGISHRTEIVLMSCEVDSNSFCGIVPAGGYGNFLVSTTSTVFDYVRFYAPTTTVYWQGASSATWSDPGNWISNMVPASNSDVVFSYLSLGNFAVTLDQNIAVNSLSLQETPGVVIGGNALTVGAGGIDMLSAINSAVITSDVILTAPQSWAIASGLELVLDNNVTSASTLTLNGLGAVGMESVYQNTASTVVSSGELSADGLVESPVTISGSGVLGGVGIVSGTVTVNSGGTLTGSETITGAVSVNNGGILSLGPSTTPLTISNSLTLQYGSSTVLNVNNGVTGTVVGLSSVNYGGTLVINNSGTPLAAGEGFQIFNAASYSGSFNRISPSSPGPGLAWNTTDLNTYGVLHVVTTSGSNALLGASYNAGGQVSVSWPTSYAGWLLQAQTNRPGAGISSNWVTIPGSSLTNFLVLPPNPALGSVFYRLASPVFDTAYFGARDVVVLQIGNGSINVDGAPGILEDFATNGGAVQAQVALPSSGANALVFGGSSYDGAISLSADGHSIVVPGYNVVSGEAASSLDSTSTSGSSAVLRAVAIVYSSGNFTLEDTTTKFSTSTIRGAAADGNGNLWAGGGSSGIAYLGNTTSAATVSSVSSSTRDVAFANGNLCFTETGSGIGVMAFTGAPTTAATPTLIINTAVTGSASPKGFAINPANTIAYVGDNRAAGSGGGVQRFNYSGGKWNYAYTLADTLTSSQTVDDIAVDFSGPNPIIYAVTGETTGNHIIRATDTNSAATFSSIEYATSGNAFRGIVLAPISP